MSHRIQDKNPKTICQIICLLPGIFATTPQQTQVSSASKKMSSTNDVIASGNHPTLALSKMKSLREKSTLCDVTLKIADKEIPAHKVVLASSSPYFEFMFTGNVKERTKECIEIDGFCPDAFLTVVSFMYSGYLVINEETMFDVLKVADFLKIPSAKETCLKYLQKHIKISNCIIIRDIAKKCFFTELEAKANSFIENNFLELINSDQFFKLSGDEVKGLITEQSSYTDDSLYVKAISNWTDYAKTSRDELKEDLLGAVNVHIQNLAQRDLSVYNPLSKKRIYLINRQASTTKRVNFLDLENLTLNAVCDRPQFDCIPPIFHDQSVYVIGNDRCGRLVMELEKWRTQKIPFGNYTAACSVPNGIYLITEKPSKDTFMYNTETNVLYPETQLLRERSNPGVAFSENCLYVCGGGSALAEKRDLRTKMWRSIGHIDEAVDGFSATSLDNRIFTASISSGKFFEFDKRKGVWTEKAEIPKADKCSCALGSTDDAVYSYNGKAIFRYNMNSDEWKLVTTIVSFPSFVCVYPC